MRRACVVAAVAIGVLFPEVARACAVCYGNPESDMAKGATAGVLVLMGIVVSVLVGILGVTIFWVRRARRFGNALNNSRGLPGVRGLNGKWLVADAE